MAKIESELARRVAAEKFQAEARAQSDATNEARRVSLAESTGLPVSSENTTTYSTSLRKAYLVTRFHNMVMSQDPNRKGYGHGLMLSPVGDNGKISVGVMGYLTPDQVKRIAAIVNEPETEDQYVG